VFDEGTVEWAVGVKDTDNSFRIADNSTIGTNDVFTLDTSGNCGIGTTSPAAKLQANGEIRIVSSASYNTHLNYLDTGTNFITTTNSGTTSFRGSNNNITTMTVKGDGKVSINKAINTAVSLSVNAPASNTTNYGLEICNASSNTRFIVDGVGNTSFYGSDNSLSARVTSDGKVGIGTTVPGSYKLYVNGNTWVQGSLETSGQLKAGTSLAIGSSGSGGYTLPATDGTNGYVLKTNGSGTVTWQADSSGGGGGSGDITSVIGGNAIDVSGGSSGDATVNHADTSTQASVNNSGYLVVQDITLDAYGHVTGINSKTVGDTTGFALTSYGTCGVRLTWTEAGTSETDTAYPTGCGGGGGS